MAQLSLIGFLKPQAPDATTETESQPCQENETVSAMQSETCDAECCCMTRDKPNQPTSIHALAQTKHIQGSRARYVKDSWFKDHSWLSLCTTSTQNSIKKYLRLPKI